MYLKGNSHQILLSEMSLPGVEVLIEKFLPNILGRLWKENPSKSRCKVALCTAHVRCDVVSFGTISVRYVQVVKLNSVCMQGCHECCPVCVRIPGLFVRVPTAVLYVTKCCVTSHDTSTGLLGTFQASTIGE